MPINETVPELLLNAPCPQLQRQYVDTVKDQLLLPVDTATELATEYYREVSLYVRSHAPDLDHEVIPAVRFGLRLFMAENMTGELVPSEREALATVYARFSSSQLRSSTYERRAAAAVEQPATSQNNENEEAEGKDTSTFATAGSTDAAPAVSQNLQDLYFHRLLASDGELLNPCVRLPALLLFLVALARVGTAEDDTRASASDEPLLPYTSLWRLRVLMRHQLSLTRQSHALLGRISDCIDTLVALPQEDAEVVERQLEIGFAQNYYHKRQEAADTFQLAAKLSGLSLEETAMMGVRTRWQQHQIVQMILNASSARPPPPESTTEEQPKTIMSESDGHDLLDRPRAMPDAEPLAMTPLHPLDKAILVALCMDVRNQNPENGLTRHYMGTYIERLLADPAPSPFLIRCQILLVRARLEQNRNRVQERSFMQLTELVDQFGCRRSPDHEVFGRTNSEYLYCVDYPMIWNLRTEYADFCFEENLYKTALDLYEQTLNWEKIIECCKVLDKRRRAESLARELLEKDPHNPMLWVALGEATRDDKHLWKAWELSAHKMAAPMRALARLALEREQYDRVIEYFDIAVKINPVFGGDWFTLGFASLKQQKWARSGEAFTRVCQIDPNDAFAWNNLASIFLRQGKLRPAFNAMSQALRNNRRDWRMWQNYFQIGCSLKEVSETTNALNIALDIAKRSIRLESAAMHLFVENTIAYLKGEIPGSSQEAEEGAEAKQDALRYRSLAAAVTETDENAIEHLPVAGDDADVNDAEDGDDGVDYSALQPFGAEAEAPQYHSMTADVEAARRREGIMRAIRARHRERTRALFIRILDMFVTDPDLYDCAAQLFAFTDGPLRGFYYREKMLRACQQKDQWERTPDLFEQTVQCLRAMRTDAHNAFELVRDVLEQPPAAGMTPIADAAPATVVNAATGVAHVAAEDAGAAGSTAAAAPGTVDGAAEVDGGRMLRTPEDAAAAVVSAFKELLNCVKGAMEASEDHMADSPLYSQLRELSATVRDDLREAKALAN